MSLEYCVNLLTQKEPEEKYKDCVNNKKVRHKEHMEEVIDDDIHELPIESFNKVLASIGKKPGNKYKFITQAGYSMKLALWNLFQTVWRTEKIPAAWHQSTLIQIQKGKTNTSDLDNVRHLHDRDEYSKFFGLI